MDCGCFVDKTEEEKLLLQYANQNPPDDSSKIPYRNNFHAIHAFEILQSFRKNEILCDIKLETDDGIIVYGHKVVLASATLYFRAMFTSFEESKKGHVFLREVDSIALQLLVDYIYTAQIIVTEDNVKVLLHAADLLQIDNVRYACCEYLKTQLQPTNCLGFKALVSQYRCVELLPSFNNFIHQNFSEVIKGDEFLSLPNDSVVELISSDKLEISSEEEVFECVIQWLIHDNSRCSENVLSKLMEHVRLPLVSYEYLLNRVKLEPLLKNSLKCKDFIIDALSFHVLKDKKPDDIPKTICYKHRQHVETVNNASAETFSKQLVGVGVLNNHLYVVSGEDSNYVYSSVELYCPIFRSWTSVTHMNEPRSGAGVGVLNGVLYVVGGYSGSEVLNSVEVYVPTAGVWTYVSSMHKCRKLAGVFALDGLLYIVGGHNGTINLTSTEVYNPKTDTWTLLSNVEKINTSHG